MYMNKKKLLYLSVVVIMIAILSFSSLAWFSDSDKVTNNFTVAGGENEKPEEIFSVDVMEAVDADGDGDYDGYDKTIGLKGDTSPDGSGSFTYEDILPGDMLLKRPSLKNTSTEYDQWVRMKVTFNNATDLKAMLAQYNLMPLDMLYCTDAGLWSGELFTAEKYMLSQSTKWTWNGTAEDTDADTVTYTFYYNEKVDDGDSVVLFSFVNIPYQLTQNDMALFTAGEFQIVVTGEAVQAENLGNSAQEAFAKVESSGQEINQIAD